MERESRERQGAARKRRQRTLPELTPEPYAEDLFVRIDDALVARQCLLLNAKGIVEAKRDYYVLLTCRKEKRELMARLNGEVLAMRAILKDIEADLPIKTEREVCELMGETEPEQTVVKETPLAPNEPDVSPLLRLERALSNIEERLKKL
jgi:hypothetical protein